MALFVTLPPKWLQSPSITEGCSKKTSPHPGPNHRHHSPPFFPRCTPLFPAANYFNFSHLDLADQDISRDFHEPINDVNGGDMASLRSAAQLVLVRDQMRAVHPLLVQTPSLLVQVLQASGRTPYVSILFFLTYLYCFC